MSRDGDAEPASSPKVQGDRKWDVTVREGRKAGAPQESRKAAAVQSQPLVFTWLGRETDVNMVGSPVEPASSQHLGTAEQSRDPISPLLV